jgi:hypothetical protein
VGGIAAAAAAQAEMGQAGLKADAGEVEPECVVADTESQVEVEQDSDEQQPLKDGGADVAMTGALPSDMRDQDAASAPAAMKVQDVLPSSVAQRFKLLLHRPPSQDGEPPLCVVRDLETGSYECGSLSHLRIGTRPLDHPAESALAAQYATEYKRLGKGVRFTDGAMRKLAVLLLEVNEAIPWSCVKDTFSNQSFVDAVKGEGAGLQASASLASKLLALEGSLKSNVRVKDFPRKSWRLKVKALADSTDVKPDAARRSRREQQPQPDVAENDKAAHAAAELMTLTWELLTSLAWHDIKSDNWD